MLGFEMFDNVLHVYLMRVLKKYAGFFFLLGFLRAEGEGQRSAAGSILLRCSVLKFIYSEKAKKFCEISTVDLTVTT